MIVKTDAIVLRSRKYRETSKILNLYTREFGKLSVIAKGARGPKSKFGATLQPMSHVCAVLYKYDQRELHLLSQCDGVTRFPNLSEDLDKFAAGMSIMELLEFVAHDEERNDQLFDLALGSLRAINDAPKNARTIQYYFELHLSDVLGFRPNLHTCLSCGMRLDAEHLGTKGGDLRLGTGGVLCEGCTDSAGGRGTISPGGLRVLQRFQDTTEPGVVTRTRLTEHQMEEVGTILREYLQSHVGGLHRLKARAVVASIVEDL